MAFFCNYAIHGNNVKSQRTEKKIHRLEAAHCARPKIDMAQNERVCVCSIKTEKQGKKGASAGILSLNLQDGGKRL